MGMREERVGMREERVGVREEGWDGESVCEKEREERRDSGGGRERKRGEGRVGVREQSGGEREEGQRVG